MVELQTVDQVAERIILDVEGLVLSTSFRENEILTAETGESFPLEVRMKQYQRHREEGTAYSEIMYVRVGDKLFIDTRIKGEITPEVREEGEPHIVYIGSAISHFVGHSLLTYAALTSCAVLSTPLENAVVLDLGCADGMQSMLAKKLGAKTVIGVERLAICKTRFGLNVAVNGFDNADFHFIQGDICDPALRGRLPLEDITVVIANLGRHYGRAHTEAVKLLDYFPNATFFIGGGYTGVTGEGIRDIYRTSFITPLLAERGFSTVNQFKENRDDFYSPKIAFISSKNI